VQDDESEASHRRLAYLPALDGVRAFAVIAVMMFHGGFSFFTGGFMGVDAFFVLSGFLITSLLVGEWRQSLTIRLGAFWARRARRLLPALLLMLLFVAFFASVIVPKGTYGALRLDALSTLLYVSNWHFILVGSNYFNETASASPLIHTWSLAVEEQFYLLWPLIVLGLLRLTRRLEPLFLLSCAAAVGSAVWMYVLSRRAVSINRVYLGTDTRSQCLFIGCALAVGFVLLTQRGHSAGRLAQGELWRPAGARGRVLCASAGVVGAAVALTMWAVTDSTSMFPYSGGFFLVGLATAGVIVSAVGAPRSIVPRFLSFTPIRYVGRISYGLYIWHWPLFLWVDHARTGLLGAPLFFVRVLVTFAVSVASFHLVERPIRRGTFLRQWRSWVAVPSAVVVVVVAMVAATTGTTAVASTTYPGSTGTGLVSSSRTSIPPAIPGTGQPAPGHQAPVRVMLYGDSEAYTLGKGLSRPAVERKYGYVLANKGAFGCGVVMGPAMEVLGVRLQAPPMCDGSPAAPKAPLYNLPWPIQFEVGMYAVKPNVVVVLAGRWEVVDREYKGTWTNILNPKFAAYVKSQLEYTSRIVTSAGVRLVFLTAACTDEGEQPSGAPWPEDDPARLAVYNRLVREVAAAHPKTDSVVDLYADVCPHHTFTSTIHGVVIRRTDGVHFTDAAGVALAHQLMPPIVAAGRAQMAATTTTSSSTVAPSGTGTG
jgi:peptidoglycan/LPS O-acetylase OafA/YrhL